MRTFFLSLLAGLLVLPVHAQDAADQGQSFVEGTWAHANDDPDLMLEVTSSFRADTLRLTLMGAHAPPAVERETIECVIEGHSTGRLEIITCPQTTLSRTSPPSDTTLHFAPETDARQGLLVRAKQFAQNAERQGNSLVVGTEERYKLVKRD